MTKIKFAFFTFLLFIIGCSSGVKNLNSQGKTIICFGDSITYGVGAKKGEDYPSILSEMLKRNPVRRKYSDGVKVINAGLSGDTTKDALARIENDVLRKDPYMVIVEFGGNDFLRKIPLRETLSDLEEIIVRIQKVRAIVVVCDTSVDYFMRGYRKHFESIARKKKAVFIPGILDGIFNTPELKSDYIHPNGKGYEVIAEKIYKAIKPYVR